MTISSIDAGKTLCELSGWSISNLQLQKLLYIANMYHRAEEGSSLINERFEASPLGPVEPRLYHYAEGFGNNPVRNIFFMKKGAKEASSEYEYLKEVIDAAGQKSNAELVSFTQWKNGAWYARRYGKKDKSSSSLTKLRSRLDSEEGENLISDDLILAEYRARRKREFPQQNK